jgi:hypothetical protein
LAKQLVFLTLQTACGPKHWLNKRQSFFAENCADHNADTYNKTIKTGSVPQWSLHLPGEPIFTGFIFTGIQNE